MRLVPLPPLLLLLPTTTTLALAASIAAAAQTAIKCGGELPYVDLWVASSDSFPASHTIPLFNDQELDEVEDGDCIKAKKGKQTTIPSLPAVNYVALGTQILTADHGEFAKAPKGANLNLDKFVSFVASNLPAGAAAIKSPDDLMHDGSVVCGATFRNADGRTCSTVYVGGDNPSSHTFGNNTPIEHFQCCVDFNKDNCGSKKKKGGA